VKFTASWLRGLASALSSGESTETVKTHLKVNYSRTQLWQVSYGN